MDSLGEKMKKLILVTGLKQNKYFSMLEIVAVIVILVIVSTIVFKRVGVVPDRIIVEREAENLSIMFTHASTMAAIQGKKISVSYDSTNKVFSTNENNIINKKFSKYKAKENVNIELLNFIVNNNDVPIFEFYPDGTASFSVIKISFNQITHFVKISPLTSSIQSGVIDD